MAITYATFSEFTDVYSVKGVPEAEINSHWLPEGALVVNEKLGGLYTTPFSSNNETAKNLSIHFAYLGILVSRTRKQDDSPELKGYLDQRVSSIVSSGAPMVLTDGTTIFPDKAGSPKYNAWSNTQEYKPTFDMRCAEDQRIDPDRIDDEWIADI